MDAMTIHAWFSPAAALHNGVSLYRTPSGSIVGVTRTGPSGKGPCDERHVAVVIRAECGGCVRPKLWGSYQSARSAQNERAVSLLN